MMVSHNILVLLARVACLEFVNEIDIEIETFVFKYRTPEQELT